MAEGPFGRPCTSRQPLVVLYRRRGAGEIHRGAWPLGAEDAPARSSQPAGARAIVFPSARIAAALGAVFLFSAAPLRAAGLSLLQPEGIEDVTFSDTCTQTAAPGDAGGLTLGAAPGSHCRAELRFREPIRVPEAAELRFQARGNFPKQYVTLELRQRTDDTIRTLKSPSFMVRDAWTSRRWTVPANSESPREITSVVVFLPSASSRLQLRGLSLQTVASEPSEPAPVAAAMGKEAVAPPVAPDLPAVPVSPLAPAVEAPSPAPNEETSFWRIVFFSILPPLVLLGFVAAFFRRLHRRQEPVHLSPLYELNLRTWQSGRDVEGIPHIGGLRALTSDDLRNIKASGFQSLWLMGLWEVGPRVRAISRNYGEDFQGSPYAIYDYKVSQDVGTEADLDALIALAHRIGMKIIVDFVPNHMGIDSAWLNSHPEFFLHKLAAPGDERLTDEELLQKYPSYFPYRTPAYPEDGQRVPKLILVAYGRDPYFYPWIDTAQLDYARPELRAHLIQMLCQMARRVDGVRCDMAMLVLKEQVKAHRHPHMPREQFERLMPHEFWSEAIQAVKRVNPQFTFIAETYWSMEGQLQLLGFDYTYNKPLYEALCHALHVGHAEGLMNFLRSLGNEYLSRSVHFLENHDEERAMNAFGEDRQRAAAVVLSTLPGVALVHQGQMEGWRERLPVQRVVPLQREPVNTALSNYYKHLLHATDLPVFRGGRMHVLYCSNPAIIAYARGGSGQQALVIVNSSAHIQRGLVYVSPGLRLESTITYWFYDLFYDLKSPSVRELETIQPSYQYPAAQVLKQGMFVELRPYDAHVFLVAPDRVRAHKKRMQHWLRTINREWSLPLPARRLFGNALTRSTDQNLSLAESDHVRS